MVTDITKHNAFNWYTGCVNEAMKYIVMNIHEVMKYIEYFTVVMITKYKIWHRHQTCLWQQRDELRSIS